MNLLRFLLVPILAVVSGCGCTTSYWKTIATLGIGYKYCDDNLYFKRGPCHFIGYNKDRCRCVDSCDCHKSISGKMNPFRHPRVLPVTNGQVPLPSEPPALPHRFLSSLSAFTIS